MQLNIVEAHDDEPVAYFVEQQNGLKTELVAVGLDGAPVAGVKIDVTLTQVQWTSVRRAEGNGFYSWDTERKEVPAGSWHVPSTTTGCTLFLFYPEG